VAPVIFLEGGSNLLGRIREGIAQSAVNHVDAQIDGRTGDRRLLAGLESHVIEQDGIGERTRRDRGCVVDTVPPAEEMKQDMRVTANGQRSQAT
jgi:hypothetical protein